MKKRIALVTGGFSGEAEISYKSAITVGAHIDRGKFDVYRIDISPAGWVYEAEDGQRSAVNKDDFSILADGHNITFDAVLMCIHGTPGEDGKLQGYFDMLAIPYTSCDAATSALTFNKRFTVAVAAFAGIRVAESVHLFRHTPVKASSLLTRLRLPVFVKPNNGGSSIGMSKVSEGDKLDEAIQKAFREDDQVLVEEFISGREFTIGVFRHKGEIIALPITEIISKKEFFDYEAKYLGMSEEITPAQVENVVADKVRQAARRIYELMNCRGIVRIDFIYNEAEGEPYMLEVNTVPGQTDASIIPQQVRAMGWTLQDFYTAVLEECWR